MLSFILWTWLGTFVVSFYTDVKNALSIFKKAADSGYKINFDNLDNLTNSLSDVDMEKLTILEWFIPFHNLKKSKERQEMIENTIEIMIGQFRITGVLEDMNEEEIKAYQEKPTILNVFHISSKSLIDEEYNRINNIEEKISIIEKEVRTSKIKDIEELKKLREEIITLSNAKSIAVKKMSDEFLQRLNDIESMDTKSIDDEPKLKKKM